MPIRLDDLSNDYKSVKFFKPYEDVSDAFGTTFVFSWLLPIKFACFAVGSLCQALLGIGVAVLATIAKDKRNTNEGLELAAESTGCALGYTALTATSVLSVVTRPLASIVSGLLSCFGGKSHKEADRGYNNGASRPAVYW